MISATSKGSFKNAEAYLTRILKLDFRSVIESAAQEGVKALQAATPRDSGIAAESWGVKVVIFKGGARITWTNSDVENGFPVVIMLQYGHGTGTGGYVQGKDFINPAMKPVFDHIAETVWKAVSSA